MLVILVIVCIVVTNALEPIKKIEGDEKAKEMISKYIQNIPDIKEQYVLDERLSRALSHYYKGKISAFPLFKVSVKIDRNPVRIPWTLGNPNTVEPDTKAAEPRAQKNEQVKKRYKFMKNDRNNVTTTERSESSYTFSSMPEAPSSTESTINTTL